MAYVSYRAACPFYCREGGVYVTCAGWERGINVGLRFETTQAAKAHKKRCCRSIDGCTDCPVYQMLLFEVGAGAGE